MKPLLLCSLLACVLASAADSPFSGKWLVHTSVGGTDTEQACTFTQKDTELTGTCESDRGTVQINGKVEAKVVTWAFKSDYNGTPLTVMYKGTFEAMKITGTVSVPEFSVEGEFSASQTK